jgi:hypothetical protein
MTLSKLYTIFIVAILFLGCQSKRLNINSDFIKDKLGENPQIYISCIRCQCVIDELIKIKHDLPQLLTNYVIYADTTCLNNSELSSIVKHSSQYTLDSIYDENYNIMLFKKNSSSIKSQLIKTEQSENLSKILKEFLK